MADLQAQLQSGLGGRYVLERELGRGGMATVYLAHDVKYDRPIALKVLHPELGQVLGPERFQREIRLAARLQHPHILTVLDSGETASEGSSRLWFTMPYVEGESLRARLQRERQLPVEDALRIAREAAQALQYAHDQGVIHRDIKPENLLLTRDGNTLVADFGVARALGAGAEESRLTETGLVVGTPAYMSPEQSSGDKTLDARTDIYSLGAVLYEMLAGEAPYTGATTQALIVKRLTEPPPSVRSVRHNVAEPVDQAIRRALAPVPADRFATVAQFAQALQITPSSSTSSPTVAAAPTATERRPAAASQSAPRSRRFPLAAAALVTGLLIGLGVLFAWRKNSGGAAGSGSSVLAVLPFENLGRSEDEYFADGVTDAIRGKLAAVPNVQVIARSSSEPYKKANKSAEQIARELGARYLLTGTVRWEKGAGGASRVLVSPELVEVSPGGAPKTRWQEPFDASLTDVFQVQADVATRVAKALGATLGSGERKVLEAPPTKNLAAYDAFLKGEEISNGLSVIDPVLLRRALGYYEQAVALDSTFSLAWAQFSRAHSFLYGLSEPTPEDARAALAAADRVLALSPDRPEGRLAMGSYYQAVEKNQARALDQYAQGQRLAPNNAELLAAAAFAEEGLGRWDAAEAHYRQAQALDPASVATTRRLARVLAWRRHYAEALTMANRAIALAPANLVTVLTKAEIYVAQGDLAAARKVVREVPSQVEPTALVAFMGTYDDLYWLLDEEHQQLLLRLTPRQFDNNRAGWAFVLAQTYALRGDQLHARAYADSARIEFEAQLRATPQDAQLHALLGVTLAYLGRKADAIREGVKGVELLPVSKDGFSGPYQQLQLVRIYVLVGEPEKALDQLQPLLKIPYSLTPGWLKVDPRFDPLRKNPRFQRLVASPQ
jgi:TolB-like protein/tetratricopeptide (TPR) repeat protein/tRNA A-37 threonylcarbamoyl transferase component Bud32